MMMNPSRPAIAIAPTTTPTAMPAFAPVVRSDPLGGGLGDGIGVFGPVVGFGLVVEGGVDVDFAVVVDAWARTRKPGLAI